MEFAVRLWEVSMVVSKKIWALVFERDNGFCRYCGTDLLGSVSAFCAATVDHLHSRAAGGSDDPTNLVLACTGCNTMLSRAKHLRTLEERKAFLDRQITKGVPWYNELRVKLRPVKSATPGDQT